MTFVSLLRHWRDRVILFATLEMPIDQLIRRLIRQERGITDQMLDDALKAQTIDFDDFATVIRFGFLRPGGVHARRN